VKAWKKSFRTACIVLAVSSVGCAPSIDAAAKADIDRRISALSQGSEAYGLSDSVEPMPLSVGQWVQIETVDAKQHPGFMTYKIVGQEGEAFWVETTSETYYGKHETRMLINFGDRKNLESVEVKYLAMRNDGGSVQEQPPAVLGLMKTLWKPIVENMIIQWTDLPREDAAVSAGQFGGCYKKRTTVSLAGWSNTSDVWYHPAVPINGLVKSVGVNGPNRSALVAFGTEGAQSAF
jgi:hypothetical protein